MGFKGEVSMIGMGDDGYDSSGIYTGDTSQDSSILLGYPTGATVPTNVSSSSGGSSSIWSILSQGISSASNILTTRFAVPQLNPGQLIQTSQGTFYQGNPTSSFSLPSLSGSSGSLLLIGGVALVGVLMLSHK